MLSNVRWVLALTQVSINRTLHLKTEMFQNGLNRPNKSINEDIEQHRGIDIPLLKASIDIKPRSFL